MFSIKFIVKFIEFQSWTKVAVFYPISKKIEAFNMAESKILSSAIPLPLEPEVLEEIVSKAKDFALMHGICMRPKASYDSDALKVRKFPISYSQGQSTNCKS